MGCLTLSGVRGKSQFPKIKINGSKAEVNSTSLRAFATCTNLTCPALSSVGGKIILLCAAVLLNSQCALSAQQSDVTFVEHVLLRNGHSNKEIPYSITITDACGVLKPNEEAFCNYSCRRDINKPKFRSYGFGKRDIICYLGDCDSELTYLVKSGADWLVLRIENLDSSKQMWEAFGDGSYMLSTGTGSDNLIKGINVSSITLAKNSTLRNHEFHSFDITAESPMILFEVKKCVGSVWLDKKNFTEWIGLPLNKQIIIKKHSNRGDNNNDRKMTSKHYFGNKKPESLTLKTKFRYRCFQSDDDLAKKTCIQDAHIFEMLLTRINVSQGHDGINFYEISRRRRLTARLLTASTRS